MPVFCGEMTLPDRQENIHILNEIENILFPSYFGVNGPMGITPAEFVEKTLVNIYYQLKSQL